MTRPRIADYAMIGNMRTAALVAHNGSIDWLCLPGFDAPACCAALLGSPANGHWRIAPADPEPSIARRYRGDTMALETRFTTRTGEVALLDGIAMQVPGRDAIDLVRIVEGRRGKVEMHMQAMFRFDYGRRQPRVMHTDQGWQMLAGPDRLWLRSSLELEYAQDALQASFAVEAGERVAFVLTRQDAWREPIAPLDAEKALADIEGYWNAWSGRYSGDHPWRSTVIRSLLTLKALSDARTGGIVGAATMGLPEIPGGRKNYDYRYCWLRDATFTLRALLRSGFHEEARRWNDWMLRSTAGDPAHLQPVYRLDAGWGLPQYEIPWLRGFQESRPVLVGNQAWRQRQMDVYGEVVGAMAFAHAEGLPIDQATWEAQLELLIYLEQHWHQPGCGIWELGDQEACYTHSHVMAWVAADRAAKAIEDGHVRGDAERWRALAHTIHAHVMDHCFDHDRRTFVQREGSPALDASLLRLPIVGFIAPDDPRMLGTLDAVERYLCRDGYVWRYTNDDMTLPDEGAFLVCGFWLVECLVRCGRRDEALAWFEQLAAVCNDVGLLSEEYDPTAGQLLGNFPQAFSHVGLVNAAHCLFG